MRKEEEKRDGYALILVILLLAMMSILGASILGVTNSNFKMSKSDSKNQSSYYIAESGLNYMVDKINTQVNDSQNKFKTSEEFFQNIDNIFMKNTFILNNFEKNQNQQPQANITVKLISSYDDTKDYKIESIGEIGNSKRIVSSIISIGWEMQEDNRIPDNLLFYSKKFSFHGTAINSDNGTIIMDGLDTHNLNGGSTLNITNMHFNGPVKMDGGSASFGNKNYPGSILVKGSLDFWNGTRDIYGDIRVNGKFRLKDARLHGNAYVNGDLELGWTPQIHKNIYYTGKLIKPDYYNESLLSKCIKVNSVDKFEIPTIKFGLKEDSWYIKNGYKVRGNETGKISGIDKLFVANYKNTDWQEITGETVIISKGDIILRGGNGFTGALIAPNGIVKYSGDGEFKGVIISKNEISLPQGGNKFTLKTLGELFGDYIPVTINNTSNNDQENGSGSKNVKIVIKSGIKEE